MGLTRRDVVIATVFTQVESIGLTAWLAILGIVGSPVQAVSAFAALEIFLETEHLISRLKG